MQTEKAHYTLVKILLTGGQSSKAQTRFLAGVTALRGHLPMPADVFGGHTWGGRRLRLAPSGWRPRTLLNTPQCTGQPPCKLLSSAELEKRCNRPTLREDSDSVT